MADIFLKNFYKKYLGVSLVIISLKIFRKKWLTQYGGQKLKNIFI